MKKVLVFPCGSEIGLEIHRSLQYTKDFQLYGGSSINDHGRFVYKNYLDGIPHVDEENFIDVLEEVMKKNGIEYIFPAHDSVALKLAENTSRISATVVISPCETVQICRSKSKTYKCLQDVIKTPRTYNMKSDALEFPVFLKPDSGQGSKGTLVGNSLEEVQIALQKRELLVSEYLPYKEYTVDCFTNKKRELLFVQGRERMRVINGISVHSRPTQNNELHTMARAINETLNLRGAWFFQVKEDKNHELTLLEVAPRIAGTMALCRMQGVNMPLLTLYDRMDIEVSILHNHFDIEIDRALKNEYKLTIEYEKVYIDFDDTIITNGQVNELLIAFMYKSKNQGKELILLTKHTEDIHQSLEKYHIDKHLFDSIIHIGKEDRKEDSITANSIFIDDSFLERKRVFYAHNVPVFDVSEAVELL